MSEVARMKPNNCSQLYVPIPNFKFKKKKLKLLDVRI